MEIQKAVAVEKRLHKLFNNNKYKPLIRFNGYRECFDINILKNIKI